MSEAGLGHTSGPASPAGAAVAVLQAALRRGAILPEGGSGGRGPRAGRRAGLAPGSGPARPGGRGRSVSAASREHLADSHQSARRGARWERGGEAWPH